MPSLKSNGHVNYYKKAVENEDRLWVLKVAFFTLFFVSQWTILNNLWTDGSAGLKALDFKSWCGVGQESNN